MTITCSADRVASPLHAANSASASWKSSRTSRSEPPTHRSRSSARRAVQQQALHRSQSKNLQLLRLQSSHRQQL
eukprot:CCRYP_020942-RC/>CCRYP_020942-RC protein AED:0.49 eAED:0.71 QI:0/0/0/1/0/0/2/0/73